MNLMVPIPDDLAERLSAGGEDIERRALEAFVAEECRAGRLTHVEGRRLLGLATHAALDAFLKARGIYEATLSQISNARERTWLGSAFDACRCRHRRWSSASLIDQVRSLPAN